MRILTEKTVRKCLTPSVAIEASLKAFQSLRSSTNINNTDDDSIVDNNENNDLRADIPNRLVIKYESPQSLSSDTTLFKPASLISKKEKSTIAMGMKCVSVRSWNPSDSLPMVPATVMLLDPRNGVCKACVGATYLTASRTAAGSAIATKLCLQNLYNNNDNKKKKQSIDNSETIKIHLVVFGAGLQAELHCVMMDTILSNTFYTPNNDSFEQNNQEFILDKITIVNRTLDNAQKLQTKLFKKRNEYVSKHHTNSCNNNSPPPEIQICKLSSCEDIVRSADVIVTATNSSKPLFDGSWVRKNCHVNCVGSYTSDTRETDQILVNRSRIIMDTKEAINVGDLNHLVYKESNSNILGLLGDFVSGAKTLDGNDDSNNELDITYYKSVGTAIQDIVTAQAVLDVAQTLDLGVDINMNDDGDS